MPSLSKEDSPRRRHDEIACFLDTNLDRSKPAFNFHRQVDLVHGLLQFVSEFSPGVNKAFTKAPEHGIRPDSWFFKLDHRQPLLENFSFFDSNSTLANQRFPSVDDDLW